LDCGYFTLRGYEAGRAVPKNIREKLVKLALEKTGGLGRLDCRRGIPGGARVPFSGSAAGIHLLVDAIFDEGDQPMMDALLAVVKLHESRLTARRRVP
jgi:hypothetical protein